MRGAGGVAWTLVLLGVLSVAHVATAQQEGNGPTPPGTIAGRVLDKSTGDPIIEAGVEVIQTGKRVRTDLDGKYTIKLPPGEYGLRIFAPLYQGARIEKVIVRPNQVAQADASLAPEGQAGVEVVEVVAQADKAAEATQLLQRQKSAVISDNIAAETIKKSPDKSAADVVKRLPAVTIQNDKFVFVRGLGERYSSALLNGSRLPSTDPNRRVVPLDLFPAEFVESLSVFKSYTPDLPGDFSGGLVDIRLKEYPEKLSYTLGVSTGLNTNATFQDFGTYKGGSGDYLGFGSESRALPGIVPNTLANTKVPNARGRAYAEAFHNIWSSETKTAPPNFGINLSIGNSWGPVGASIGGVYTTEYKERRGEIDQVFTNGGTNPDGSVKIQPFGNLTLNRSMFETRLGGVFTSAWKITHTDKVSFRALVDHNSFDEVVDGSGENRNNLGQPVTQSRLQYTEDQLGYGQLSGEHQWSWIHLDWRSALSQTTEDQPDTRFVSYNLPTATNGLPYRQILAPGDGPESLERLFANLDEYMTDSAVDVTIPFQTALPFTDAWSGLPAKFKFGPAYTYRHRSFDFRRFSYPKLNNSFSLTPLQQSQAAETILQPQNIGTQFGFQETGRPGDSFSASQEIAGAYGMVDLPLVRDRLRLVAGVRTEYSYIRSESFGTTEIVNNVDPLPGANLIYNPRSDMNVRYGYSRSVSRPDFRELTPTQFPPLEGELEVVGNPLLTSASIESHDLRWEWFLSPTEVTSFGVFYKELSNPIENVILGQSASNAVSFVNAQGGGTLYGLEAEARKNLGCVAPQLERLHLGAQNWLNNTTLMANVAYIDSQVDVGSNAIVKLGPGPNDIGTAVQTNAKRALQGQAPYVVNAAIEYDQPGWGTARLLYNTIGPRIVFAGTDKLPDIFEEPRNKLDLVLLSQINPFGTPLTAKLSFDNLLDEPVEQTQGDQIVRKYSLGVKVTFGISYTY